MKEFAALLDSLSFEPSRNGKLRLMTEFFRATPDPERGYALAALTEGLKFQHAKPALVRMLLEERVDPVLFNLSYHYVGDLSECAALLWPQPDHPGTPPLLSEVVIAMAATSRAAFPRQLALWLDSLDEIGRWALLKLVTGSLRIGVSARLAKTAVAALAGREPNEVEEVWHGLIMPYGPLFAWLDGSGPPPNTIDPAPFRPPMLAHPLEERESASLQAADFQAEWKWDGIRVQAVAGTDGDGQRVAKLYSRAGEDISTAFPDLLDSVRDTRFGDATVDGELLVMRDGRVQPFGDLQQRLNRKMVSVKAMAEFPAHLRCYDLLAEMGEDLRTLSFADRRLRLEAFVARVADPRIDLSPLVPFSTWDDLAAIRADPAAGGAGPDAEAVEGLMLKRRDSVYVPGRPKGLWFKWKRNPFNVDAVLMYAQRGHGKRASFYSDYTFGVWRGDPAQLVPVGKAYSGFTDQELAKLDRYVRTHTISRFGPVREVEHTADKGLVLEIAFEGLNRSNRHKSGLAMRFPRVNRIRWDKPTREADRIEALEALLSEDRAKATSRSAE